MATQIETGIHDVIIRRSTTFMETFRRGDAAGMGELYTEDGQILPPNGTVVRGRPAIAGFWRMVMDLGITDLDMRVGETEQHGETAVEVSTAALLLEGGQVADEIKYIVVWKHEGGEWKLHRDIWNSSRSAQ
jgi:uncharacterized protein (TIGR02246 family)